MTCKQLGGVCDMEFHADSFREIADMSKKHGMEMFEKGDPDHIRVMKEMKNEMNDPNAMKKWITAKEKEFDKLPEE